MATCAQAVPHIMHIGDDSIESTRSRHRPGGGPVRRRRHLRRLAALAIVLACVGYGTAGSVSRAVVSRGGWDDAKSRSTTAKTIRLGLAFDYAAHDARAVARNVGYIYGGYFVDWNFGFYPPVKHIDGYLPFDADPYSQNIPGHSLADWRATHPDWIVYQCDGKTPAYYGSGDTNVPLDFSNPAVRAWQIKQAAVLFAHGAPGVAFDDFTFANFEDRCGVYRNGVWTPLGYPGAWQRNQRYTSDMMDWLRDVSGQLHRQFPTKTLTVNFAPSVSGLGNLKAITPYIDMDFDEAGFTSYGHRRLADGAWQQEVAALEYLNRHGKAFDVNGIVDAVDERAVTPDQIGWVLANYLLVKGSASYTYVYASDGSAHTSSPRGYGRFYDRPEYHVPIGHPTSGRYATSGLQLRGYSGGLVLVNPRSSTGYIVALESTYKNVYGSAVTSVTLPPTTGIILLGPASASTAAGQSEPSSRSSGSRNSPLRLGMCIARPVARTFTESRRLGRADATPRHRCERAHRSNKTPRVSWKRLVLQCGAAAGRP